jgi:hypothetical protein
MPQCKLYHAPRNNTEKTKEDEYLLYILAMSLPCNEIGKTQFLTKVRRAYERNPKLVDRLLARKEIVLVDDTVNNTSFKTFAAYPENRRVISIFTCIAKGLYWHENRKSWPGSIGVVVEFMLSRTNLARNEQQRVLSNAINTLLANIAPKGENPDVFSYQFAEFDGRLFARLHFFGDKCVTAQYIP